MTAGQAPVAETQQYRRRKQSVRTALCRVAKEGVRIF